MNSSHSVYIKAVLLLALLSLVPSCSESEHESTFGPDMLRPGIFRYGSTGNWVSAGCDFTVLNSNTSIVVNIGGIVNCPAKGAIKESFTLVIPGNSVGDYENNVILTERSGNAGYFYSAPNAFSASISYIDSHSISGTFHGTKCSSVPAYCYDITDGEFQLHY